MSNTEFRKKMYLSIVISIITVALSNWGTIYYQRSVRNEQIRKNSQTLEDHSKILANKVNKAENDQAHAVLIQDVNENKAAVKDLAQSVKEDNQFIIENILEIKNQLIEMNGKNNN